MTNVDTVTNTNHMEKSFLLLQMVFHNFASRMVLRHLMFSFLYRSRVSCFFVWSAGSLLAARSSFLRRFTAAFTSSDHQCSDLRPAVVLLFGIVTAAVSCIISLRASMSGGLEDAIRCSTVWENLGQSAFAYFHLGRRVIITWDACHLLVIGWWSLACGSSLLDHDSLSKRFRLAAEISIVASDLPLEKVLVPSFSIHSSASSRRSAMMLPLVSAV